MRRFAVRLAIALLAMVAIALAILGWAYWTAIADPTIRRVEMPLLPAAGGPARLRLVLLSDIHVAGPDMPPRRLARIVAQVNALRPDAVLLAGDFVSDKHLATRIYSSADAIAPLAGLRSRFGSVAVLGNHEYYRGARAERAALRGAGIAVLANDAVRVGPLAVGGLDDPTTGHGDLPRTLAAMARVGGTPILLSHGPDPFARLPRSVPLMLAGHTHCGQFWLPIVGVVVYRFTHGPRYECGRYDEAGHTLIVTAGIGTSLAPLRLWARPEIWAIDLVRRPAFVRQPAIPAVATIR